VVRVGLVARTKLPEPVEDVVPVPPEATGSVPVVRTDVLEAYTAPFAVNDARPVPPLPVASVPVTPVLSGRPEQLESVPLVGVPRTGVTSVGLEDRTTLPVPVEVVTPVPPLATGRAVPESVTASVPELVIGVPETDRNAGTVMATEVTVPEPVVIHEVFVPSVLSTLPALVACAGRNALSAVFAVVAPVPPEAIGRVPVVRADVLEA
jgi:hypothetical protein